MKVLTKAMCWEVVSIQRDRVNKVGIAIYRKTTSNECYMKRSEEKPSLCPDNDDPNAAWYITSLQTNDILVVFSLSHEIGLKKAFISCYCKIYPLQSLSDGLQEACL